MMLDKALIDHCRTSGSHPQEDDLEERLLQTLNVALLIACSTRKTSDWVDSLAAITTGCRMSSHESPTHFSLYYLLIGRQPLLGRSVSNRPRVLRELDLDDEKAWVQSVAARA